jgi:choline dehydrogenase-like flavoprotein
LVKSVIGSSYNNKKNFKCEAKVFVLACGGIENVRLMRWFSDNYGAEFSSPKLPIGEYWMEHPHFTLGEAIVPRSLLNQKYYTVHAREQKRKKMFNCGFRVEGSDSSRLKELIIDLSCAAPELAKPIYSLFNKNLICSAVFRAAWEQAPDIDNHIRLNYNDRDEFGVPRTELYWSKKPIDRYTIYESINTFLDWQQAYKYGHLKLEEWLINKGDYPKNDELAGNHHMGGTRMHADPRFGVVDSNCKLYGSKNFYVAGSSVFTTGGHANPTLTIVQLSLRLADHLLASIRTVQ